MGIVIGRALFARMAVYMHGLMAFSSQSQGVGHIHSMQSSALSHFKRDVYTQDWLPNDVLVQNKVNKMPKKLQYVAGLRGSPTVKMNVIRLDMDLGQPHQH